MVKKLTAYEAQRMGQADYEIYMKRKEQDEARINALTKQLEAKQELETLPIELHIKEYSCYTTREYLKTIITQIQPISDVIQLDWRRR